jgi:isoaspartyl peptidase/L-asparaginase-like protein (Ntn-hydrolase superfamily)
VEEIVHAISLARAVMEKTRHVMLVGQGAQDFALANGFQKTNLLSEDRKVAWEKWKAEQRDAPGGPANHDTITMIGLAKNGDLAGGCSTSGLGYKLPGRVGDSPILGSGLYVDNEIGGAGATGTGENVMRYCATFQIVEAMRHGMSPQEACVAAIRRIAQKDPLDISQLHINFIAIDKQGHVGAAGTDKEFRYAVTNGESSEVIDAEWVR